MFVHDKWIPLYFFIVSSLFLLYMKKYKRLCKVIFITILFYIGQQLLMLSNVEVVQFVSMLFMMIVRLMPTYIVALILMYDYQPSEVISALQSIHVPRAFIIALSITLRYIPTFFRELRYINESMRLRGIRFEMKNIIKSFGYFVVPQLFRCLILADELTAALDPETSQEIMNLLLSLKKPDRLIILATHNPVIWEKADEVIRLNTI